jgi:large subunit ribosomal protein L35
MARMKLKNHKGVAKRFARTGTGKLMRRKAGRRHILTTKNRSRKRRLKDHPIVDPTVAMSINRLLPYNP